jgi:histidyl-tRNA synthetase
MTKFQAIRGMNDILPEHAIYWQHVESVIRHLTQSYGYQELRFPIVELTSLFKRTIGEVTDIVEKEMYTFSDRNNDSLTLRPEGTAGCVRAGIEHGLLYNQIQRFWYMGPMFRHEKPQKGRYRQFHQFGVEAFGLTGPDIDAEMILLGARLWKALNLSDKISLQLNNIGTKEERAVYRNQLAEYFTKYENSLDDDSKRRLTTNPLRILDSKNPLLQDLINSAPSLLEHLQRESLQHFDKLQELLTANALPFEINPKLVRGLDYYTLTVFEWVIAENRAQNTICAGGRYNDLVEQLGGKPTPAIGFALGMERIIELFMTTTQLQSQLDAYFIMAGATAEQKGLQLAEQLRTAMPEFRLLVNCGNGDFKNQFKRADKSGARFALVLGDNEMQNNTLTIKFLREEKPQQTLPLSEAIQFLKQRG